MVHQTPTCCGKPQSPATNGRCYNLPYEKIGKNEPVCIADEVPFEIPESWEWVTLKQVATSELGKTLDKSKNTGLYHPYLCSINVYWTGIDLSTVKRARFEDSELPKYRLKRGDLLICEGGDVGRSAVWDKDDEMYYQNALHRVRFYGGIDPYFFQLLLECYKSTKILDKCSKGMTIKHLVQSALNSIYFPLPPLNEQRRIIEKVNHLTPYLERYNTTEARLSKLNSNFPGDLKQSILQYAVQGNLVPQDPTDEPASALLERIRAEKEQLIKSGKIKRDKHESVIFRRDNSYYERVDGIERCIDDEIPFEIPESWEWARIKHVGLITTGNTPSKAHPEYFGTDIPFVSPGDIHDGKIDVPSQGLSFEGMKVGRIIPQGSILQVCIGGSIGKAAICNCEISFNQQINAIEPIICNSKYLLYVISSAYFISKIKDKAGGTATPIISKGLWENVLIPLSPFKEQQRIVARIDALLHKLVALQ